MVGMDSFCHLFEPQHAPKAVPRPLSAPPPTEPIRRGYRTALLLFVLALLPRIWMATKYEFLSADGPHYVLPALAMADGYAQKVNLDDFNLFPITGSVLVRLGLEVESAFKYWNVLCSSLLVPVAYGYFRRQFNERIGVLSALLLAAHPKLIEWSSEVMRDPSFTFYVALAAYSLWRAVVEIRVRWFALAGMAVTMAVQTRFEGWLLFMPALTWWLGRYILVAAARRRLLLGLGVFLAALPVVVLAMNLAIYGGAVSRYEIGANVHKLQHVKHWMTKLAASGSHAASAATPAAPQVGNGSARVSEGPPSPTKRKRLWAFVDVVQRGCTPVFGVLLLAGLWWWRSFLWRWEILPILGFVMLTLLGIWIHLGSDMGTSTRYCLTIVFLASPFAVGGLLGFSWHVGRALSRLMRSSLPLRFQSPTAAAILLGAMSFGTINALASGDETRIQRAELGQYIRNSAGEGCKLAVTLRVGQASYYAKAGQVMWLPTNCNGKVLVEWVEEQQPHVVVLWRPDVSSDTWNLLARRYPVVHKFAWNSPSRTWPIEAAVLAGPKWSERTAAAPTRADGMRDPSSKLR